MKKLCIHCGEEVKNIADEFCCLGCAAAYKIVGKFGLENYYKIREINQKERKIKPEDEAIDIAEFVVKKDDYFEVNLMVQGLHCAACVWLIESILQRQEGVILARINLSKKTLLLRWRDLSLCHPREGGDPAVLSHGMDSRMRESLRGDGRGEGDALQKGNELVKLISDIGYKLLPFDQEILAKEEKKYDNTILRALAVAGFGVGNIMLMSFSLWFVDAETMGVETRNLLHFFSSLIALPVIAYAARPFFTSAWKSIKAGFPNMDLAIAIAIFLACIVSILETFRSAHHVYFDSAVMLIFFLLIGRYLDLRARKRAFAIATEFSLLAASFGRVESEGKIKILPTKDLREGMMLLVATGEKIAADGVVISGESEVDMSLINGEILPKKIAPNSEVFAGTINLGMAVRVRITKASQDSLLSQIIALSEDVESKKNHYIRIADRLARFYLPAVHILAFATFLFWFKNGWEMALMNATAVLIITCPCALALAVPIVQTIAISNFIRKGILVKSGEALEKINEIGVVVFDKTGSVTVGKPRLVRVLGAEENEKFYLQIAASLARKSKHPLSLALVGAWEGAAQELEVKEYQGSGLEAVVDGEVVRLGNESFCDGHERVGAVADHAQHPLYSSLRSREDFLAGYHELNGEELLCFLKFKNKTIIFIFEDEIKSDAKAVIAQLQAINKKVILLSGDIEKNVKSIAEKLGISEFYFAKNPVEKLQFLQELKNKNQKFIMIGDGLNDAPALALADVSISFNNALDISQNVADIIIQGQKLQPIIDLIKSSKKSILLMKQNLLIALIYNLIAVPFAVMGIVVPLIAAIAMSSSSLLVLFNSFRMNKCRY